MAKRAIGDMVLRLKQAETVNFPGIPQPMEFKSGEEFHIVADVVYMQGFPLPPAMQSAMYNWLVNNPTKFIGDNRAW